MGREIAAWRRQIRASRQARRLSLRALAEQVDCDHTYLCKIERGTTQPSPALLRRIAKALGLNERWMLIQAHAYDDELTEWAIAWVPQWAVMVGPT